MYHFVCHSCAKEGVDGGHEMVTELEDFAEWAEAYHVLELGHHAEYAEVVG